MAYKNWKKNYHSTRIGNRWVEEGFCDWWDFGGDWKKFHNEGVPYARWRRVGGRIRHLNPSIADIGWRVSAYFPGIFTPVKDLTYPEAVELSNRYGEIERKKLLSAGGYRSGRKTYFKGVYNARRRRIGKQYCDMVVTGLVDDADNIDQGKDRHFLWDID